ncbi:MAG: ArgE/DapE family deacylase [Meiothermus sp.]|nr:ArgE/DapE family deacylase [Meiothermus sp.]
MTEAVQLLAELLKINSVNPDLQPGAAGEGQVALFVADWLKVNGFEVHWLEATPGRPSVVGIARGAGGGRSLMFNGHLDTVGLLPFEGEPLEPVIRDGRMYGRGSFDMKSGLAAMLVAAKRAKSLRLRGDILVACVADEEYASIGTEEVARRFSADAAIVTEPTHLDLTVAHKGFVWLDVVVHGRAAHGSRPELGIDAIAKMGKFLAALEQYDKGLRSVESHPLLKHGSVHASLISGGQELSSYPAECRLSVERRTLPHETPEAVERELLEILQRIAAEDSDFKYTLTRGFSRSPMEMSTNEPIIQIAKRQVEAIAGKTPSYRGEPFWTDAAILKAAGIPAFLLGVDGAGAHAAVEYVELESMEKLTQVLVETAKEFCA